MRRRYLLALGASTLALAVRLPALAQGASAGESSSEPVLPSVVVQDTRDKETATSPVAGYTARRSATATKTDTPLLETPQAVTILTTEQIRDQGATTLQDALGYAAGVRSDAYGYDSRSDGFRVRGDFPDEYLDNLRKSFNFYTSTWRVDPFTLERIEVLRGPSAMLYGQGTTAGVVNMVSKRPLDERHGEVGVQLGSWGRKQLQTDLTGPLTEDGTWLYRIIAVGRDADTQVDYVSDDRLLLAPSLTWRPSARTAVTLLASWQRDRTGSSSQFFPWAGTVSPNPNGRIATDRFIGDPNRDRYDTDHAHLGWTLEHEFSERWSIHQNVRYMRNDVEYRSVYGDPFTTPGAFDADPVNQRILGRNWYGSSTSVHMLSADQFIEGKFSTGPISHDVIMGADIVRYRQTGKSAFDFPDYQGGGVPSIDVYAPIYGSYVPPDLMRDPDSTIRQSGVYLHDQMRFATNWIVVAGLRHDRARNSTEGNPTERSSATSKRFGLLYAFENGVSPYVSYSESFTPQANMGSQSFDPKRGKQWETGIKYEVPGKGLFLGANLYDLKERNRIEEVAPNVFQQLGKTSTRGAELELRGALTRNVDIEAHYNYTDADEQLEELPKHQAAVWAKWRFALAETPGFSVGAGARYFSGFADGAAPRVPSVTLFDAMLAWENSRWRVALNASNLTDKVYVATCLERGDCWWGARRNVLLSVSRRW